MKPKHEDSSPPPPDVLANAENYTNKGWRVIPIPFGEKGPRIPAWNELRLDAGALPARFAGQHNVGVLLGEPSGWLVDVDLDRPEAVMLAPYFLPNTGAIFGRAGKPKSHWLYKSEGATTAKFSLPKKWAPKDEQITTVEIRSNGTQTVFPGSVHPTGEHICWDAEEEPAVIPIEDLRRAVSLLHDNVAILFALRSALDFINPDIAYDDWVRIGMALFRWSDQVGFTVWDKWSSQGSKYRREEMHAKWTSFRNSPTPEKHVTLRTLFHLAQQEGWECLPGLGQFVGGSDSEHQTDQVDLSGLLKEPKKTDDSEAEDDLMYTVRSWGEVSQMEIDPQGWFWGNIFSTGQLQALIGQGGLGKSRISLNLARNQILGEPFGGELTFGPPLVHLLMGSENSIHRLQYDIRRMSKGLSKEQLELLNRHIHLATIEGPSDAYISLDNAENRIRWRRTIERVQPDVLWVDPYGDIQIGDANSDSDTRATLGMLQRILRQIRPTAGIVILHHARTGADNIMQAVGFGAANFGKGSKALFSACRAVVNLAPGNESESPPILIACSKNNNGPRFETRRLNLDPENMTYSTEDVNINEWLNSVAEAGKGPRGRKTTPSHTVKAHVAEVLEKEALPSGVFLERICQASGVGEKRAKRIIDELLHDGTLAKTSRLKERDGRVYDGTPDQVSAIMNPKLPKLNDAA